MIPARKRTKEDIRNGKHLAAQMVQLPLSDFMVRLVLEEMNVLDSHDRTRVNQLLREYKDAGGELIETQEQLPAEIRELFDL